MSRSRAASHGVNLLPLLDVLLCTMGTLIVVLGVVNREARLHPMKHLSGKAAAIAAHNEELADARDELEWHVKQLSTAREKTLADLENARLRLSGIEDHSRKLEDQLNGLMAAGKQLADAQKTSAEDAIRAEVQQLNARRAQLEKDLEKARVEAANRKPVYAVIPFEGIYQTSRRPIYIECRGDSIILQPEGITFTASDFLGPGGPSNPLAAALRAAQEYWRQAPKAAPGIPNEPYPLMLVRPNGIIAYYLVRDAMSSWDAEFGYELVGADWKLDFPMQPEPRLKEMEARAVADARERLQWLAQASPEVFSRKSKTQYRMSSVRGGVARDNGPALGNDPFADDPLGGFGKSPSGGPNAGGSMAGGPGGIANGSIGGGGVGRGGVNGTETGGVNSLSSLQGNSAFGNGLPGGTAGNDASGTGGFGNSQGGNGGLAGGGGDDRAFGGQGGIGNGDLGYPGPDGGGTGNQLGGGNGGGAGAFGATGNGLSGGGTGGGPEPSTVGPRYAGNGATGGLAGGTVGDGKSSAGGGTGGVSGAGTGGSPNRSEYGGVAWPGGGGDPNGTTAGNYAGGSTNGTGGATGSGSSSGSQLARADEPTFNDIAGLPRGSSLGGGSSGGGSAGSGSSGGGGSSASGDSMASSSSMAGQGSASGSSMAFGTPSPSINYQSQDQQQRNSSNRSVARNRGRNWALPNGSAASVPIQRPIRIECYSDRLVLLPDSRDQQAQVIPMGERTDESVDQLVSAVRTYTKTWGMAGRSMYWKPQLLLEVKPNAENRAHDLQALLADSGLDVQRK